MSTNDNIEFQLYDWMEGHDMIEGEDGEEDIQGDFIIHSFGRCMDGKSVYAKVIGYTPYFYIILPSKLQMKSKAYLDDMATKMCMFFKGNDNKKVFYKFKKTLKEVQIVQLKLAEGFTNNKPFWFARLVFTSGDGMKKYKYYLEQNDITIPGIPELYKPIKFKLYEANLPPMLRCFHIREISGCSWVETSKYELVDEDVKTSRCDIEIVVDWRNLNSIKKDTNAPLRICSFDIECNSIDGEFPQARRPGDCVIQIGCTYTVIGQSKPYRQYIACLNKTSPVENTIVESCDTEKELMFSFLNEINNNDCDIITGYNTFFFDEKYMYDRCKNILRIESDMAYMSKLKNHKCNFKEMKLASSALGENLLRFWDTPGRIHIDLMKDIQKTFNLPSYKLDYVASKFIRGDVISYKLLDTDKAADSESNDWAFELVCKSVSDISIGDYIHLEVIKGFVSDEVGEKYIVIDINMNEKKIIVVGNEFLAAELDTAKQGGNICWSQAKDDVGPKDIFRLQKGSADDRAIVAKYCVKDCKLVNLLINKLEVVTKNIEMANVCYVPLSYLFIRGQGIKLFSLCLREFRKHKIAFPVLKLDKLYRCNKCTMEYLNKWDCPKCKSKDRDEVESESSSYEGAIVFDPVPKVDYEALATKDYMSLYPASIMHKNMSHETIVEDVQYDNLPGIKYYNAQFKESDGSMQYRRFAQINDDLGVIPTILNNLLKERKSIKKLMKTETDPFKYKILDAKQLAVKITANSLYGQLGAATSPVCKRDIAACTTSTGREMLILAKKYDEERLPWIINGLKYAYKNNMLDKVEKIYDMELKARNDTGLIENIKKYVTQDIPMLTIQPVIRYGDTDSIFSCYRFRENTTLVDPDTSLVIWKKVVGFAKTLISPYFGMKEREVFTTLFDTYYGEVTSLQLPIAPQCMAEPKHHAIILPLEERIKMFLKEYMEESYIPWLWTLAELVEMNYTNMFDIKLTQWAEHQLSKIRLVTTDLIETRRQYILEPIMVHLKNVFNNSYVMPSDEMIVTFAKRFNKMNKDCFPISSEINIEEKKLMTPIKNLMEKTIKDKWVLSGDRKAVTKLFTDYMIKVVQPNNDVVDKYDSAIYYLKQFITENKKCDMIKLVELINTNLLNDTDFGLKFNEDKLGEHTKDLVETFFKESGTKTLDEILEDFLSKELGIDFNLYKTEHYNTVIQFVNTTMRRVDMSDMDKGDKYSYYWLQPRWDFDDDMKLLHKMDIYEGGLSITDKRTLDNGMEMGKLSGELIKAHLPFPHDCEYEKTFWPFAILTKKRYVGNKYEDDPNKYKQDFMGIVLKRRDNAPIVKEICGGIIDYLINKRSPKGAKDYLNQCLEKMFNGEYDIKYFLQSRTLKMKESYKDWKKIAHVYLAEKIARRDPGNTPQSGDRIEFAVIKVPAPESGVKLLQGDIIEIPSYIKQNKLEIDYLFYLTNQIMNPALQFLELVDPNASKLFTDFIDMYKAPKVKPVKEPKPPKPVKTIKAKANQSAIELLIEVKKNKKKVMTNKKFALEIKKFIDNINEFMEEHKIENKFEELFLDSEVFEV